MNTLKPNDEIMDVFFLGAGKPKAGKKPSSLREMGMNKCALDWQLHSLKSIGATKIHFLGGYHIEEVIEKYPYLNYIIVPDWESRSILHTLFQAVLRRVPTLITLLSPEAFFSYAILVLIGLVAGLVMALGVKNMVDCE